MEQLPDFWKNFLKTESRQYYMTKLRGFLAKELRDYKVFPEKKFVFRALELDISQIKVVILGQDPYHTPGVANGLAFATSAGMPIPPSLQNIFKELKSDLNVEKFEKLDPTLLHWHTQGIMLLNTCLTVRSGIPNSHRGQGWEVFTDKIVTAISVNCNKVVFILWGASAGSKEKLIDFSKHLVVKSVHPSPFSAHKGFFGSRPFSKVNEWMESQGLKLIDWV